MSRQSKPKRECWSPTIGNVSLNVCNEGSFERLFKQYVTFPKCMDKNQLRDFPPGQL